MTIAEVCVGYFKQSDEVGRAEFLDLVRSGTQFEVLDFDIDLANESARIRAEFGLNIPDAIIVATGLKGGAEYVVTHDDKFQKSKSQLVPLTAAQLLVRTHR